MRPAASRGAPRLPRQPSPPGRGSPPPAARPHRRGRPARRARCGRSASRRPGRERDRSARPAGRRAAPAARSSRAVAVPCMYISSRYSNSNSRRVRSLSWINLSNGESSVVRGRQGRSSDGPCGVPLARQWDRLLAGRAMPRRTSVRNARSQPGGRPSNAKPNSPILATPRACEWVLQDRLGDRAPRQPWGVDWVHVSRLCPRPLRCRDGRRCRSCPRTTGCRAFARRSCRRSSRRCSTVPAHGPRSPATAEARARGGCAARTCGTLGSPRATNGCSGCGLIRTRDLLG